MALRHFLLAVAGAAAFFVSPAVAAPPAAVSAYLPTTCQPGVPGDCVRSIPITNPDGTLIGTSGGGSIPTGTAGSPNAAVVTVQGVSGGTVLPITAASLPLPSGAATSALQAQISGQLPASLGAKTGAASLSVVPDTDTPFPVVGNVASGAADSGAPVKVGCVFNSTLPTIGNGQRSDCQSDNRGHIVTVLGNPSGNTYLAVNDYTSDVSSLTPSGLAVDAQMRYTDGTSRIRARGDATGAWAGGHATIATNQAAVTTGATLVCAARTGRQKAILTETTAVDFYYGASGVTTTTGSYVKGVAGASVTLDTAAAIYAVGASAVTITCAELY